MQTIFSPKPRIYFFSFYSCKHSEIPEHGSKCFNQKASKQSQCKFIEFCHVSPWQADQHYYACIPICTSSPVNLQLCAA